MRKLLLGTIALIFLLPVVVFARANGNATKTIGTDEIINNDLFASAEQVTIDGVVNGDVFVAAKNLQIRGVINGDIYAAAESIEIGGTVRDDVHLAARSIKLNKAKVGDSALLAAETASFDSETTVGGSLIFGAQTIVTNAPVGRGIKGGADSITINNSVAQDINVNTRELTFGPKADIKSGVSYQAEADAKVEDGAKIAVQPTRKAAADQTDFANKLSGVFRGFVIWSYLGALLSGLLLLWFMRRPLLLAAQVVIDRPWPTLGWGALSFLLAGPLALLLLLSIIGIPFSLLITAGFLAGLYVGKLVVSLALGRFLLARLTQTKDPSPFVGFVLGLSILYILKLIPLVNVLTMMATTFLGLGAILTSVRQALTKSPKVSKVPKPPAAKKRA